MRIVPIQLIILFLSQNVIFCQDDWSIHLGQKTYVDINHLPYYRWIPDGHISVLPDGEGKYVMYWSEFSNSRTTGDSQFPEDQITLDPVDPVFGGRVGNEGPSNGYNDGGSWLMSVHRHEGDTLIGFYHGESHWYPRDGDFTAWKSICLAYSYDNGYTWEDQGPIVTSNTPKPETRRWGGAGDCCVIWDPENNRWNCYHQEHNIRLAVSYDPLGAPGTWKKYYNGEFNEDGLGGMSTPISNLSSVGGANPSVHWNTFYNKWFMVYHGWDGGIYVTLSSDGVDWEYPTKIISKNSYNRWYPTIIGETDTEAGRLARLYYAEFNSSGRSMAAMDILFDTTDYDYGIVTDPWKAQHIGSYNIPGKAGMRDGMITITGTTNNLFEENDAFYFMYQNVSESGGISTRLTSQTVADSTAYSGIMLRSSLDSGSAFISLSRKSPTDTITIIYRDSEGQKSKTETIASGNNWFKIQKENSNMTLLISEDGISWDTLFSVTLELSTDFYAGLFNTAHDETNFCTATFENTAVNFRHVNVDRARSDAIRIYPNPAVNRLSIHLQNETDMFSYKLIDISGKIYREGRLKGRSSELDISDLPSNQYFIVQIFDGNSYVYGDKIFK
jgi:hypothetical protein